MHRHHERDRRDRRAEQAPPTRSGSGFRFFWLVVAAGIASFAMLRFQTDRSVAVPPNIKPLANASIRDIHTQASAQGVLGGVEAFTKNRPKLPLAEADGPTVYVSATARADHRTDPQLQVLPMNGKSPHVAVRVEHIQGTGLTREDAIVNAVKTAREKLAEVLRSLDPPIVRIPPEYVIRKEFVLPEGIRELTPSQEMKDLWKANGLDKNRQLVEVDIEVSEEQLRGLHGHHRMLGAAWIGAVGLAVLLTVYGFLRIDAWTKGYLTTTLGITATLLIGGVITAAVIAG